jgi:rhamnosyltransferase
MKPKVAILLAAYNGIKWIEEQVSSILSQNNVKIEIFISVDFSTDGTYDWCKSAEANNNLIHVLPYGKRYGGAAKNFFRLINDVNISKYEFVAFSDQDDIWYSDKLSRAVKLLDKYTCDGFSSDVTAFWNNGKEINVKKSFPQKKYDYIFEAAGPGCTYVFKREALDKFKIFLKLNWRTINKVALHDWMIYAFFRSKKLKWHIDQIAYVKYRQHSKNEAGVNYNLKAYKKRILLIKDNWYKKEVEKISSLINFNHKLDFWFRIKNFWQLRRRPRDVFVLLIITLFGFY